MNTPMVLKAKVLATEFLNDKILKLSFESEYPLNFLPGQYVSIKVDEATYRAYSICSSYKNKSGFDIVASVEHKGPGAVFLKTLKKGDRVQVVGPRGKFLLKEKLPDSIYFLTTGTGIAPFISYLYYLTDKKYKGKIVLFYGNRFYKETFFLNEIEDFKQDLDLSAVLYLSQDERDGFEKGRITQDMEKYIDSKAQYYLCGNPFMIEEAVEKLLKKKISEENIIFEKYTRSVA